VLLKHYRGAFYAWTGTCYREHTEEELERELYAFLGRALTAKDNKLGCGLINAQPKSDRRKLDECEVVCRELVVARCHSPTMLDLVKEPLD
jgi:hypothetical protein